jgi:parallel beta-helix repeat protein
VTKEGKAKGELIMNKKHLYATVILLLFLAAWIQPVNAIDIPTDESVGTWDGSTYTLNQNVTEGLVIVQSDLTLDGNGHTVSWESGSQDYGVDLEERSGVTVKNLSVTGFVSGISLRSCPSDPSDPNNVVTGNTVFDNDYGIRLVDSCNVIVENNNVYSNDYDGISIVTAMAYGHFNILSNNTVSNNDGYGITLGGNTDNNEIYNNTVSNNGTGIYLCVNAQYNTIYNNNFENTTNASVIGDGNVFDLGDPAEEDGKGGNYWSNWTSPDDDSDGIVDSPYVMPPYDEGQDNYPWTIENGWLSPELLIVQLIDTVAEMNLQQGIDNSLDAKLDAAFNALDDVNQNNDVAAINSLNAFINAVEAQRGVKITSEQADILIADANYIISQLNG